MLREGKVLSSGSLMTAVKHLRALDSLHSTIFNLFSFSTQSRRFSATFFFNADGGVLGSLLVRSIEVTCCWYTNNASFRNATAAEDFLKQLSHNFKPAISSAFGIFTPNNHKKSFRIFKVTQSISYNIEHLVIYTNPQLFSIIPRCNTVYHYQYNFILYNYVLLLSAPLYMYFIP